MPDTPLGKLLAATRLEVRGIKAAIFYMRWLLVIVLAIGVSLTGFAWSAARNVDIMKGVQAERNEGVKEQLAEIKVSLHDLNAKVDSLRKP